jgi:NAD-dependent deacetylase
MGKLKFLISQNVDNLHIESGIPLDMLAELHGNGKRVKCLECDARFTKEEVGWDEARFGKGYRTYKPVRGQPECPECGGRIISSVVNFGDPMPEKEMKMSSKHAKDCDLFIVLGSSLVVTPAADLPRLARHSTGAKLVIVNKGETPMDDECDLRFWEGIGEVFPPAVRLAREMIEKVK